jgi:hypothetical protein
MVSWLMVMAVAKNQKFKLLKLDLKVENWMWIDDQKQQQQRKRTQQFEHGP